MSYLVQPLRRRPAVALLLGIFLAGEMLLAAGCTTDRSLVSGRRRAYGYSWDQEVQIGRESDQQIVQQFGLYEDQQVQAYVDRIGQELVQRSHLRAADAPADVRSTPCTFRVLSSHIVNAFALPGCYIYVTRGLLTHMNNEAQLAVVLGHEIGHVSARHSSQQAASAQLGQLGVIGAAILGQGILGGSAAENILNIGGTAFQLLTLKYSRDNERESDQLGVEYSALSGYQAAEGSEFFNSLKRLGAQQGGGIPSWASTHPDPGEREQTILELAREWSTRVTMTEVDQQSLYQRIEGMVVGPNPREGFVESNTFYHPDLKFSFPVPSNWVVQNERAYVAIVEPNQQAYMMLDVAAGASSAQAALAEVLNQQGVQVQESGATRVNGLPAHAAIAQVQTDQGTVGVMLYAIEYGGNVYRFMGVAPAQAFRQFQGSFENTMGGFRQLTDSRILNRQPARLRIVTASRTAPFSSFVPANLPFGMTAQELAILNQVELNESVQQGTRLKLPG